MSCTPPSARAQALDALTFPLHGSRLIEASAGTGKTWTIAALYLRLVLGHGNEDGASNAFAPHGTAQPLLPSDILVMTFTRAATRELVERIRARLVEAVACFRGSDANGAGGADAGAARPDPFLQALLAAYPTALERERAAWRLANAAECMDEAAIFTIDAWCQRVLREHALDSASLLDETLEADEARLRHEALQDYWRQHCYPLGAEDFASVQATWPHFAAFAHSVQPLLDYAPEPAWAAEPLTTALPQWRAAQQQALAALAQQYGHLAQDFTLWFEQQLADADAKKAWNWRSMNVKQRQRWLDTLRQWAEQPTPALATDCSRLTPQGLDDMRQGDVRADIPAAAYALAELQTALAALPSLGLQLRQHAAACVAQRLAWLKSQNASFGFADMLQRLDAALSGPHGAVLRQRLQTQYPVAMLDEFQDTSPLQYRLFNHIYAPQDNAASSALLLIGDPKQSIYSFRGADIYSYLAARRATVGRHYVLGTNYRSTAALVDAVNHWFTQAEQRPGGGAFNLRTGKQSMQDMQEDTHSESDAAPLPFIPVQAQGRKEQLQRQGQPLAAMQVLWQPSDTPINGGQLQKIFASACAEQVAQWLGDASMGFSQPGAPLQRLRPADIAILVRDRSEAAAVRRELDRRRVPSVYLSDRASVFASSEAQDLLFWLQAVAEPLNTRWARAALATRLLDFSLAELQHLASDDEAFDARTAQLRQLQHIWQRQGVLAMLRASLHLLELPGRWLAQPGGERRLTNVLHLGELLQHASAELEGEQALIRWLADQVNDPNQDSEAHTLRLESDADLVQVITIHKSKGLEYPIVMLPFASQFKPAERKSTPVVRLPDGQLQWHIDDAALALAEAERLREDLRLFYVALTRPRHHLWLGLGPIVRGNNKACQNEKSASGYLLAGTATRPPSDWEAAVLALQDQCQNIVVTPVQQAQAATVFENTASTSTLRAASSYSAAFDRRWGVASFSALVRDLAPSADQALLAPRPADDEDGAAPAAAPSPAATATASTPVWHQLPRGPLVGNFIHEQLQWLAAEGFAPIDEARLLRRCTRAGYAEHGPGMLQWLQAITRTRLPVLDASLQDVGALLTEMEFWLPLAQLPSHGVDALCCQHLLPGQPRPPLPSRALHGMLMGFADLVLAHQGRYWVLDYKTNALGADSRAYDAPTLAQAMLQHRYDVQAALYSLALHRLLQSRLGTAYDPAQHLGGALYFFVRGVDGSTCGLHHLPIPVALLDALDALLDTPPHSPLTMPPNPQPTTSEPV